MLRLGLATPKAAGDKAGVILRSEALFVIQLPTVLYIL